MNVVSVPKKLAKLAKKDLIVIPRQEYKALRALKKVKNIRECTPTLAQKNALQKALKNYKEGKMLTLAALRELRDPKKRGKLPRYTSARESELFGQYGTRGHPYAYSWLTADEIRALEGLDSYVKKISDRALE